MGGEEYVQFLEEAKNSKKIPSKQIFDKKICKLCEYAKQNGLTVAELGKIFGALKALELDDNQIKKCVQCLIPQRPISAKLIDKILSFVICLDANDRETLMSCLFIWVASLLDFQLVDEDAVNQYYNIFDCMLEYFHKPISHLLFILTKPGDVLQYRVNRLQKLISRHGQNEPYLCALLNRYKSLNVQFADIIVPKYRKCEKVFSYSESFYVELRNGLSKLRDSTDGGAEVNSIVVPFKQPAKRARMGAENLLPNVRYLESKNSTDDCEIHNIKSATEFTKNFHKIKFPSHTLSLLNTETGIYALMFKKISVQHNFFQNLYAILDREFIGHQAVHSADQEKLTLLNNVLKLHSVYQQGFTCVSKFLSSYLFYWDGVEYSSQIYKLLEWFVFESEYDLSRFVLRPLHALFVAGDPEQMCEILRCLTNLIVNLSFLADKYNRGVPNVYEEAVLKTKVQLTPSLQKLSKFMSHLFKISLYAYPCNNQILLTAITFYKKVNEIEDNDEDKTVISSSVMYYTMVSFNAELLNEVCALMPSYREKMQEDPGDDYPKVKNKLNRLDNYLYDLFNFLWTSEAFSNRANGKVFLSLSMEEFDHFKDYLNPDVAFDVLRHMMFQPYRSEVMKKHKSNKHLFSKKEVLEIIKVNFPYIAELLINLCLIHKCDLICK